MPETTGYDYDKFLRQVALDKHEPLSPGEKFQLQRALTHPLLVKALGLTMAHLTQGGIGFLEANLGSQEGLMGAVKLQGALLAYPRFVETLGALAIQEDQGDENV